MGINMRVLGVTASEITWHAMKKIYDNCIAKKEQIPWDVWKFLNCVGPDEATASIELAPESHDFVLEYRNELESGIEIDISKLPKDIKKIRFVNSR